ncbi:MAG: patatin-like phospholipase family protein [Candidatus Atribacteria bacterium]|nr:patatin-like phospholipase family protein [Candidatus Atribacteria bacterium]
MQKIQQEIDPEFSDLLARIKKHDFKIGLALGSGSAKGMAHIGVIQTLNQYQIPIHLISGTSIGAVIGSVYATGITADKVDHIISSLKRIKVLSFLDPTLPSSGLFSGSRFVKYLEDIALKDMDFSDLKIPFAAVATDIKTGAKVILNHGNVAMAVRASCSLPGIFAPVPYQEYFLVDGGLVDPVPVDIVRKMGADLVIAVNLTSENPKPKVLVSNQQTGELNQVKDLINIKLYKEIKSKYKVVHHFDSVVSQEVTSLKNIVRTTAKKWEGPHIFEVISKSIDIMEKEITEHSIFDADIVIEPTQIEKIGLFEYHRAEKIIASGKEATRKMIPHIIKAIKIKLS